jgi:hypothetical protein
LESIDGFVSGELGNRDQIQIRIFDQTGNETLPETVWIGFNTQ